MSIIYKRERWRDYVCEVPLDIQKYTWPSSRNRKRTEQIAFLGESSAERLDFNLTLKSSLTEPMPGVLGSGSRATGGGRFHLAEQTSMKERHLSKFVLTQSPTQVQHFLTLIG